MLDLAKHKTRNKIIALVGIVLAIGVGLQLSGMFDFNDIQKLGEQDYFDVQTEWYTQTGNFYELSISDTTNPKNSYYLSCKEFTNLDVRYKGSSTYIPIQSSTTHYFDPVLAELVSRTDSNKVIDQYRLKIYANCNFPSYVEVAGGVRVSGTYDANIYNSNPLGGSAFFYIDGISGNTISSHGMRSDQNMLLKTVVFDGQALENKLKIRTSDGTVQFSVLTDTDLVFEIDTYGKKRNEYKRDSDVTSMVVSHSASVKLTDSTPAPTPTTANSRDEVLEITKVYQTKTGKDLLNSANSLDTSLREYRQITIEVRMAKYISDPSEGTPIITIREGNGLVHGKYNTYFLSNLNDDRNFFTRVIIPQDSTVGTWSIDAENVNRSMKSHKTFKILNSIVPTTAETPKETCEANGGIYDSVNLSCSQISGDNDCVGCETASEIKFGKIGLIWKLYDKSGNIINNDDTRSKGAFDIPSLQGLELISTTKNKAGNQQSFDFYSIQPQLIFTDESGSINTDTLNQFSILESTSVVAELSIIDEQAPVITKSNAQAPVSDGGISIPLGVIKVSRADVEKLATDAGLEIGDYFSIQMELKGGFTIVHKTTSKQYNGFTDGVLLTQEFRFGNPDDSSSKEQECTDRSTSESTYVWKNNNCVLLGGGECDNPEDSDCPENPPTREECDKLPDHTWIANECVVINPECEDCKPEPKPEPKPPKPEDPKFGFCEAELTTCIDDAIKKALKENQGIDTTMIYLIVGAIIAILILVIIIKLSSRNKYTYSG